MYFVVIIYAAGITRKRTIRDHRISPRFSRVKTFVDGAITDHHLTVGIGINIQRAAQLRHAITGSIETAVYGEETVVNVGQRSRCKHIRFLLGTGVHHAEFGVIEHHCAATRNDIHIPFNVAVGHQRTRLTIRFQTVLHTAVGDKEGVLTTENVDVIDLHFVAISTQCHRRMVTRIYAIAQRVFDGQVLQLQAIVL